MTWGLVAVAGSTLVGGVIASSASQSAASQQAAAANNASNASLQATQESNQLLANQYAQNEQNQAPWLNAGGQALAALEGGLGLSNPYATQGGITNTSTGSSGSVATQPGRSTIETPGTATTQGVNVTPGGSANGQVPMNGANGGVVTPGGSANGQVPTNGVQYTTDASGNMVPVSSGSSGGQYNSTGTLIPSTTGTTNYGATPAQATQAYNSQQTNGVGNFTQTFTPSSLTLDPSYQFRLQQGEQALASSAAARGLTGSGQNLKDTTDYAQGAASQEYQAAYDRFMETQNTQYNRLAGLAGVGQTTAANLGSSGASTAGSIASNTQAGTAASNNYLTGGAAASAAGTVGSANAINNSIGSVANTWMGSQYLNKIGSNTPSTSYSPSINSTIGTTPTTGNYSLAGPN